MSALAVLAIDAGQTGVKTRLLRDGRTDDGLTLPGVRTDAPLAPQFADAVHRAAARAGAPIGVVAIGASGLVDARADADALLALTADAGVERVLLAHDSVTSYLGSLGDTRGAVVAAGTGVVALAVGRTRIARIDGWGNIMGDAGSGHWIGREVLDAVMRAHDGRGAPTALADVVRERWPDLEAAYIDLQSDPDRVRVVASFAERAAALAASDETAARIVRRAADELALSAATGLDRVRDEGDARTGFTVGVIGGVFRSDAVRERFAQTLAERWPGAGVIVPQGTGLDGAAALAALPSTHALHAAITVASPVHAG